MNTNTQNFISKININALNADLAISQNVINQDGNYCNKLFISVPFDGYHDVVSEVKTLANVIEVLSMQSSASDKENLELITSVSRIIQKIIPDLIFADNIIFKDPDSTNQNFKPVKELI